MADLPEEYIQPTDWFHGPDQQNWHTPPAQVALLASYLEHLQSPLSQIRSSWHDQESPALIVSMASGVGLAGSIRCAIIFCY